MPVKVLKCISAEKHSNANSLYVYKFCDSQDNDESLQVVANLTNIYNVGDLVYVALEGTVLKDGTKIKKSKIRGEWSSGMALGKIPGVGDDCSHFFCAPEEPSGGSVLITAGNDTVPKTGAAVTIVGPQGPTGPYGKGDYYCNLQSEPPSTVTGPSIVYKTVKSKNLEDVRASDVPRGLDPDNVAFNLDEKSKEAWSEVLEHGSKDPDFKLTTTSSFTLKDAVGIPSSERPKIISIIPSGTTGPKNVSTPKEVFYDVPSTKFEIKK